MHCLLHGLSHCTGNGLTGGFDTPRASDAQTPPEVFEQLGRKAQYQAVDHSAVSRVQAASLAESSDTNGCVEIELFVSLYTQGLSQRWRWCTEEVRCREQPATEGAVTQGGAPSLRRSSLDGLRQMGVPPRLSDRGVGGDNVTGGVTEGVVSAKGASGAEALLAGAEFAVRDWPNQPAAATLRPLARCAACCGMCE